MMAASLQIQYISTEALLDAVCAFVGGPENVGMVLSGVFARAAWISRQLLDDKVRLTDLHELWKLLAPSTRQGGRVGCLLTFL
jgi:hypothetical protein